VDLDKDDYWLHHRRSTLHIAHAQAPGEPEFLQRCPRATLRWVRGVEGLYCKRPIQCLASSKILTPHPLTARSVSTPLWCGGRTHSWVERGWGGSIVWKTPDTALYSIICKYFVKYSPCSGSNCISNHQIKSKSFIYFPQLIGYIFYKRVIIIK
jgi:hypothetical protein